MEDHFEGMAFLEKDRLTVAMMMVADVGDGDGDAHDDDGDDGHGR